MMPTTDLQTTTTSAPGSATLTPPANVPAPRSRLRSARSIAALCAEGRSGAVPRSLYWDVSRACWAKA